MGTLVDYGSSEEEIGDELPARLSSNGTLQRMTGDLPIGPAIGPSQSDVELLESFPEDDLAPQSPYSANRTLLRDLTLPTVPNYDIPPLPSGSPIASTNAKFLHFLELKKQGVHFNERLSKSSALKNPSLMQKLMAFSNISDSGQYGTILGKEMWNSDGFPEAVYKEELSKSQQLILKSREATRSAVNFVPAAESVDSIRNGSSGSGQKSAAERIMAGLNERPYSPQGSKRRKTRFES